MLYLLTALPGSGKTQYAIERFILDEAKANPGRPIYANIKGLRVDAIAQKCGVVVGPSPLDWRTLPDGSLVIYDEAQSRDLFPATGKPGLPEDERISALDTHRHRGFDIVLITQDPALVHHWARKFVGRHIHLVRPNGAEMMTVLEWGKAQSNPEDHFAKQEADTSLRKMNPETWALYDSATVHTHKFKMPAGAKWAIRGFLLLCLCIPLGFWLLSRSFAHEQPPESEAVPVAEHEAQGEPMPALPSAYAWRSAPTVEPLNGCAAGRHCRCWDFAGKVVEMDDATCRNLAEGHVPFPIDLNLFRSDGGRAGGEGRKGEAAPAPGPAASVAGVRTAPGSVGSPRQGEVWGMAPATLRADGIASD